MSVNGLANESTGRKRPRRNLWALIVPVFAVHFIVLALAPSIPSHRLCFGIFFCTVVLVPGFLLSTLLVTRTTAPQRVLLSFVLGTALCYIVLLAFSIGRWDIRYAAFAVPAATVLLFVAIPPVRCATIGAKPTAPGLRTPKAAGAALGVLILATVLLVALNGDPLSYSSDSLDHIAYIRTISRTHEAFPQQFLYRDGGSLTRDIRKGLGHALWGALNAFTGRTDAHTIWPIVSIIGSAMIILALYCSALLMFGSAATGVITALLFVFVYRGGLASRHLLVIAHAAPFGGIFFITFLGFLFRFLPAGGRTNLMLASVAALAATGTHVNHFILIVFIVAVCSAAGLAYAPAGERIRFITGRIAPLAFTILLVNFPYLVLRFLRDYQPNNEIHSHTQGIFSFTNRLYVLNPLIFYAFAGRLFVLSLVSALLLWKRAHTNDAVRYLSWGTIAVLAVVFNPALVPLVMGRISYLLTRLDFAAPSMFLPAYLVKTLWDGWRGGRKTLTRGRTMVGWIAVILLAGFPIIMTPFRFAYSVRSSERAGRYSARCLEDLYRAVNEETPAGSVIASDPVTSYCIPAFTDAYIVCTYDQHSIPNDSTALERILDMREVYRDGAVLTDIAEILRRYGASHMLMDGRIPPDLSMMYWKPDRLSAEAAIERFKAAGESFSLLYEHDGAALFAFSDDPAHGFENEPFPVQPYVGEMLTRAEAEALTESGQRDIRIRGFSLDRTEVHAGDSLSVGIEWVALSSCEPRSYTTYVRFDGEFDRGPLYREWYGKVYRKLYQRIRGGRYRFTVEHLPLGGIFPPDLWPPLVVITDRFTIRLPQDLSPGDFRVKVKLAVKAQYPNYVLSDLLSDDDSQSGSTVAWVTIRQREAAVK